MSSSAPHDDLESAADEASKSSFPASDPPAPGPPGADPVAKTGAQGPASIDAELVERIAEQDPNE